MQIYAYRIKEKKLPVMPAALARQQQGYRPGVLVNNADDNSDGWLDIVNSGETMSPDRKATVDSNSQSTIGNKTFVRADSSFKLH